MDFLKGELVGFDKPLDWTSFDVVNKFRYALSRRLSVKKIKVGHAGTLDPKATGVLVLCTGGATKRIEELQSHTKEYIATLQLGATTPSFDLEKPIDATYATDHITREMVEEVLTAFTGEIRQVPPTFSACKVDGKRAYDLARRGEAARHQRDGAAGLPVAGHDPHPLRMQQRHLHASLGARHRRGAPVGRPPHRTTTYTQRRHDA